VTATTRLGFRNRPISPDYAVATQISRSLRGARSYQRQHVPLTDAFVGAAAVAAGGFTGYSVLALWPADTVVSARLAVMQMTASTTFDVEINGALVGSSLGGTWSSVPAVIDFKPFATPAVESPVSSRIYVRLKNVGATVATFGFQVMIVVLR
jgi:hypothetical protein